jgi:D,D-heptose 1,7-bisphosphate phosphatase
MSDLQKCVFLDRDGVINKERTDYVKNILELEIFSEITESIKKLKINGFLVIIITNQSAINRGLTSHEDIEKIHNAIQVFLKQNNTFVDGFYYCPHRPDENCDCRKPKPGLILRAAKERKIDLTKSWMVGDNESDLKAGISAGCKVKKVDSKNKLDSIVKDILNLEHIT